MPVDGLRTSRPNPFRTARRKGPAGSGFRRPRRGHDAPPVRLRGVGDVGIRKPGEPGNL